MSIFYLHKKNSSEFTTIKDTIEADLHNLNSYPFYNQYTYKKNLFNKFPKTLLITGEEIDGYVHCFFEDFPVEKVIIGTNFHTHSRIFDNFYNARELEVMDGVEKLEIYNYSGLKYIRNLTIPFSINSCEIYGIRNSCYLRTITIKYKEHEYIIELDNELKFRDLDILVFKNDDVLSINLINKFNNIKYIAFIKEERIKVIKKYNKFEILPNNEKVLDLIKLKKEYCENLKADLLLEKEKVILTKKDYVFLKHLNLNILKEIEIKDDNDMSLMPKKVNIKVNDGVFEAIEVINNKVLILIKNNDDSYKYVFINENLNYIEFDKKRIDKLFLNFDSNKFNVCVKDNRYTLELPFDIKIDSGKSRIINKLINSALNIVIKSKDEEKNIYKALPTRLEEINIRRYSERDFMVYYKLKVINQVYSVIYIFDENDNKYIKYIGMPSENYLNKSYDNVKKLIKK